MPRLAGKTAFAICLLVSGAALPLGAAQGKPPKTPPPVPITVVNPTPVDCYSGAGCLDGTFGVAGKVLQDVGGVQTFAPRYQSANAVAVQPDGKVVAAGTARYNSPSGTGYDFAWVITRFLSDGTLDPSFGSGGIVRLPHFTATNDIEEIRAMAVQSDGKIVVAGWAGKTPSDTFTSAVVRLDSSGNPDTSFGSGGVTLINYLGHVISAMTLQGDGKIVVVASGGPYAAGWVGRLNTNGSLDTSFNGDGFYLLSFSSPPSTLKTTLTAVAVQSSGKILVGGDNQNDFAIARLTTSGDLDTSFGKKGYAIEGIAAGIDGIYGLAVASDDSIVAAGRGYAATGADFSNMAFARFSANGALDTSFGSSGKVLLDMHGFYDQATAVRIQTDGKIVFAGRASTSTGDSNYFSIVGRLTANGALDSTFGSGGVRETSYNTGDYIRDTSNALAIDALGRIVVAGFANADASGLMTWALARYFN